MEYAELDSEIISDQHLNSLLASQKVNQFLQREDATWQEFTELDRVEQSTLSKRSDEALKTQMMIQDVLGMDDHSLFHSPLSPLKDLTVNKSLDLDSLQKSAKTPHEILATRLWKVCKSTGTPSEEMQRFFEKYQHLVPDDRPDILRSIKSAIASMDFTLFLKMMGEIVSMSFV